MKAEEIQDLLDKNYNTFLGKNEAETNFCTEIENEFNKKQSEIDELVVEIKLALEGIKELNGEFQEGWEQNIERMQSLIQKHTKK